MNNLTNELMTINYLESPYKINEELNINPEIPDNISSKITEIYEKEYLLKQTTETLINEPEMIIKLKHEQPITFKPRRLEFNEKEQLRIVIDDLIKNGTVRPSNSPCASPIVLIRNKTGENRLCVDYPELNKITIKDNFPTFLIESLIEDHLDQLKDKKYFTNLDLKNGFHHIKMSEPTIKYTSFVTPLGKFEYLKMPFALTNAPPVFQRYLNSIFDPH